MRAWESWNLPVITDVSLEVCAEEPSASPVPVLMEQML